MEGFKLCPAKEDPNMNEWPTTLQIPKWGFLTSISVNELKHYILILLTIRIFRLFFWSTSFLT